MAVYENSGIYKNIFQKFTYVSVLNINYARFKILVSCLVNIGQLLI
jgi:hypothetical protein